MFTLDTESGFRDVVFITASYGLGETVVQGAVNPDEFYVHKPMLERGQAGRSSAAASARSCSKMVFADATRPGGSRAPWTCRRPTAIASASTTRT